MAAFIRQQQPYHPDCKIDAVCGFCVVHDRAKGLVSAVDHANIARKTAKRALRTCCIWFDDKMAAAKAEELELQAAIQYALRHEEFTFYLQPKVNLATGKLVGAEALARWPRQGGQVAVPGQFLPLMEQNGTVADLDFLIYHQVCAYLADCCRRKLPMVPVSMNISRAHLEQADFAEQLHQLVESYGVHPSSVEFELTEDMFAGEAKKMSALIGQLRGYGYKISIDDFGSGYSSLNLLQDVTFDVLKMDRHFVSNQVNNKKNDIIVASIVQMAEELQVTVLCEGVETLAQAKHMRELGCQLCQGFFFHNPLPTEEFERLLLEGQGYFALPWAKGVGGAQAYAPEYVDINQIPNSVLHAITHSLYRILPGGLVGVDIATNRIIFANDAFFALAGYSREEVMGRPGFWRQQVLLPQDLARLEQQALPRLQQEGKIDQDITIRTKQGALKQLRLCGGYANSPDLGHYLLCFFFDHSSQQQSQQQAKASRQRLEELLASLKGGVARLVLNDGWRLLEGSDGFYRLTGFCCEDWAAPPLDERLKSLVLPEDLPALGQAVEALLAGTRSHLEFRIRRKDESIAWLSAYISKVEAVDGQAVADAFFFDITREQGDAMLRQMEQERLRAFYQRTYDSVYCGINQYEAVGDRYRLCNANAESLRILGLEHLQQLRAQGKDDLAALVFPEDLPELREQLTGLKRVGDTFPFEHRIRLEDGSIRWVSGQAGLILDQDGKSVIMSTFMDCTSRKALERS